MHKEISINGVVIPYEHKVRMRGRSLRLTMHKDKRLVLSTPRFVTSSAIESFLRKSSKWILEKYQRFQSFDKIIPKYSKEEYRRDKQGVQARIERRLEYFSALYGYTYDSVSVKDTSSRWGSCSKRKSLNFSFKMKFLPDDLFDYVIVHELCHLQEFNHSKAFWKLVEQQIPNWKEIRTKLKNVI